MANETNAERQARLVRESAAAAMESALAGRTDHANSLLNISKSTAKGTDKEEKGQEVNL